MYFPACGVCEQPFTTRSANTRYCSAQCRIDNAGARVNDLYATATALHANGKGWYDLLIAYLRERDGDHCGICLLEIDFTLRSGTRGSDLGRSIDHIHPRSLGGSDDADNLRLAHWGCNRRRKAKVESSALFDVAC